MNDTHTPNKTACTHTHTRQNCMHTHAHGWSYSRAWYLCRVKQEHAHHHCLTGLGMSGWDLLIPSDYCAHTHTHTTQLTHIHTHAYAHTHTSELLLFYNFFKFFFYFVTFSDMKYQTTSSYSCWATACYFLTNERAAILHHFLFGIWASSMIV